MSLGDMFRIWLFGPEPMVPVKAKRVLDYGVWVKLIDAAEMARRDKRDELDIRHHEYLLGILEDTAPPLTTTDSRLIIYRDRGSSTNGSAGKEDEVEWATN